jgi:aspartyl-tRNA(Asn)/glutamyl-tRNA(Gln) amidotransferase subunit A
VTPDDATPLHDTGPTGPAIDIARQVRRGERSAREVVEHYLGAIDRHDGELHAFVTVLHDGATAEAEIVDRRVASGEDPGPLAGVPVAVKDNMCTRGVPTTCSSRILGMWRPPYDATVVERLRAAGAVVIGKTNLDEFAMGSSTENSAFGPTRNPYDLDRVPGGSSGGSAAAVAAGLAPLALGSDTGGSIRQPAALCGVVGMKPTYGAVSRYGLVAFASSLDQIGPLTVTVGDAAVMFDVIGGHDPRDSTCLERPPPRTVGALSEGVGDLRVGVVTELLDGVDAPERRPGCARRKSSPPRTGARPSSPGRRPHPRQRD